MLQDEAGKPTSGGGLLLASGAAVPAPPGVTNCSTGEIFYTLNEAKIVIEALETALQHRASAFTAGIPTAGASRLSPRQAVKSVAPMQTLN